MCGIAGFIDPSLSKEQSSILLERMLNKIAHRGPDARGKFFENGLALGHNRLSIIDLSDDGIQPMHHFGNTIVYNGEIYNYIELRDDLIKKGFTFKTQSDTEVILAAYKEYGRDCVNLFMGMWAFAIWDEQEKLLFCSRDRFGIKPFNYIANGNRFYFASEYKALKESPVFNSELNLQQMYRGLQLGWISYEDETYFNCIKSLPAACNLIYKDGKIEIEKYWDIDPGQKYKGTLEEASLKFRELFTESIRMHMRADVEVGGCLSGGVDSSTIASCVSQLFPDTKFKTFTIYYSGKNSVDERPWVDEVKKKYPGLEGYTYSPDENEIEEAFRQTMYHADVPIAGSSPVSQYFVMKLAKEHNLKVILDGQGADEYLAGYMHSFYRLIGGLFSKAKIGTLIHQFGSHAKFQEFSISKKASSAGIGVLSGLLSENQLYQFEYKNYYPFLPLDNKQNIELRKTEGSRLNKFLYHLTFNTSLPSLLHYEDRNSMAFSIESRVPFLDHQLVEFVFSLPDEYKFHDGITKFILRNAMSDFLPKAIVERRDKKGFVTPGEIKWLNGPLKFLINDDIQIDSLSNKVINKEITKFKKGNYKAANLVWRIAALNYWLKH